MNGYTVVKYRAILDFFTSTIQYSPGQYFPSAQYSPEQYFPDAKVQYSTVKGNASMLHGYDTVDNTILKSDVHGFNCSSTSQNTKGIL